MTLRIGSRLALLMASLLAGCGFQPLLGTQEGVPSVAANFAKVHVAMIDSRTGQVLRNDLIEILTPQGEPAQPAYTLTLRVEEPLQNQNYAFQRNNSVTDVNYSVIAYWSLLDKNGVVLVSSTSSASELYAMSSSQYASTVSAQNTRDQDVMEISQDIRNQLAQYFLAHKPAPSRPSRDG